MKISRTILNLGVSAAVGVVSGTLCWTFLSRHHMGAADFGWAHDSARFLLAGRNPYANTPAGSIPYPLPAALLALPFAPFSDELAAGLFFGISSGLLAFGLVRQSPERLFIFLAYPYWAALLTAQWAPLVMTAAFFAPAFAMVVAKPQIAIPVAFTHPSRRGLIAAAVLLAASFVVDPRWPLEWLPGTAGYQHFFPLLILPGPWLALALWRWRDPDARLLLLCCILPQRWFYDSFVLWLIPKTRRSILGTVACSWLVGMWRWYHTPHTFRQVGLWAVLGFFFPMLVVILRRSRDNQAVDPAP